MASIIIFGVMGFVLGSTIIYGWASLFKKLHNGRMKEAEGHFKKNDNTEMADKASRCFF